jgi:HD-GYP domain-containing protein (c-di-GMP phosphodiesterase class II)
VWKRIVIKLNRELEQLGQGMALPWTVFDAKGRSLLRKGMVIDTPQRQALLTEQAIYRSAEGIQSTRAAKDRSGIPFFVIGEWMGRLHTMLHAIAAYRPDFNIVHFDELCIAIQGMCAEDADAALAAIHLDHDGKYAVRHLIHSALLVELVTNRMGKSPDERQRLIAATLTANVGMLDLQERLMKQDGISSSQRDEINRHPEEGVTMLRLAGVQDELWLELVLQHHERLDGSGYPRGLRGDEITEDARIMAIADIYHAKISERMHRAGMLPTDALRQVLLGQGNDIDSGLSEVFIKELGVYPPGAFVRLANGDIAVVTHRGQEGVSPRVASIITPRGVAYPRPLPRDPAVKEWSIKEIVARDEPLLLTDLLPLWGY